MKTMYHDKMVAVLCGIGGGMGKYLLDAQLSFPEKLLQAAITAFICGLLGAAGKYLFDLLKPKTK